MLLPPCALAAAEAKGAKGQPEAVAELEASHALAVQTAALKAAAREARDAAEAEAAAAAAVADVVAEEGACGGG